MRRTALIRRPSPRLAEGIVTNVPRQDVDYDLALREWFAYVDAYRSADWRIVEVPPADDCPDSVFIEDTMVVYRNVAVIARPGAAAREPEILDAEKVIESLGYSLNRIRPPGTLDGGDVLQVGDTVYVGRSQRTNGSGIAQLRDMLGPVGATVAAVPVRRVLHLKSAATALCDGTVIGYPPFLDDTSLFSRFLAVTEPAGGRVVPLDERRVLLACGAPRTAELLADLGYHPVVVDIDEFEKLEGCVTCLTVRLEA